MREEGIIESFPPKIFINDKKGLPIIVQHELIYCPSHAKLQKYINFPLLHEGQFRKNKKCTKRVKKSKSGNKIRRAVKFRNPCKIARVLLLLLLLSSSKFFF